VISASKCSFLTPGCQLLFITKCPKQEILLSNAVEKRAYLAVQNAS